MTIVDQLVVKLGLDSKEFSAGAKSVENSFNRTNIAAKKTGRDIEQSGKQGAEFFNQLRKSAIQFFSVLTVGRGLADFTSQVINSGASLDRMSRRLGESASELSRWQSAAQQSGGSADGLLSTVQNLSAQLTQLKQTGDAPIRLLLGQLGVSAVDASLKAKSLFQIVRDIGDALESKPWSEADKFNLLQNTGLDEGLINLLLKGRAEREKLLAAQTEFTDSDARKAREAQEKWEATKKTIERTTQRLVIDLLPALEQLAKSMADLAKTATPILSGFINGFNALNELTGGWLLTLGAVLVSLRAIGALLGVSGIAAAIAGSGAVAAGAATAAAGTAAASGVVPKLLKLGTVASLFTFSGDLNSNEAEELAKRRSLGPTIDAPAPTDYGLNNKLAAAEKANGLPSGLLASIIKQEVGNRKEFLDDPTKYHYEKDASGKRKSSAFGPLGILESTAKDPGYGVKPLQDKSIDEQIRFAAEYAAARIKSSGGDVAKGVARYGEGAAYADQVLGRLSDSAKSGISAVNGFAEKSYNVSVSAVNVYTQATDANGIARDINDAIIRQADFGMR